MRRLSSYTGEAALDLLADLVVPAMNMFQDKKVPTLLGQKKVPEAVKCALKEHKKEVLEILAILEGVPVEKYNPGFFVLPVRLLELFSDPDLLDLFISQGQKTDQTSSGSASVNTEVH